MENEKYESSSLLKNDENTLGEKRYMMDLEYSQSVYFEGLL